jgi:hypothetical protein
VKKEPGPALLSCGQEVVVTGQEPVPGIFRVTAMRMKVAVAHMLLWRNWEICIEQPSLIGCISELISAVGGRDTPTSAHQHDLAFERLGAARAAHGGRSALPVGVGGCTASAAETACIVEVRRIVACPPNSL